MDELILCNLPTVGKTPIMNPVEKPVALVIFGGEFDLIKKMKLSQTRQKHSSENN
jgi:hypothetical protein